MNGMMAMTGYGVNDVYPPLIDHTMNGHDVAVARPHAAAAMTKELHPLMVELKDPRQRLVTAYGRPVNVAFALAEVLWILRGRRDVGMLADYNSTIANYSDDGAVFNAAYGFRMRHSYHDQLADIIKTLEHDPTSRQAVMSIWDPRYDRGFEPKLLDDEHVGSVPRVTMDRACNLMSHALIRDGALDWTQVMRSNDALWGVPYNWMQWTHIQEYVAFHLGVPMGYYYHIADSFHIYEHQYEDALAIHHFDIYEHMPSHSLINFDDEVLREIELREVANRTELQNRPRLDHDDLFWQTCLTVWFAHLRYKGGNNEAAMYVLSSMPIDPVYATAQLRFYWTNRWSKLPECADWPQRFADQYPAAVAAWITGDVL